MVSGHDLVRQLEQLPVDRNSRPLQDAMISNCGELIRQVKGNVKSIVHRSDEKNSNVIFLQQKTVKKVKDKKSSKKTKHSSSSSSSESSDDDDDGQKKSKKKLKKDKKKNKNKNKSE